MTRKKTRMDREQIADIEARLLAEGEVTREEYEAYRAATVPVPKGRHIRVKPFGAWSHQDAEKKARRGRSRVRAAGRRVSAGCLLLWRGA
jgi:hypothetical protein